MELDTITILCVAASCSHATLTRSSNCGRRAKLLRSTLAATDAPAANARNLAQLIAGHARTADCS